MVHSYRRRVSHWPISFCEPRRVSDRAFSLRRSGNERPVPYGPRLTKQNGRSARVLANPRWVSSRTLAYSEATHYDFRPSSRFDIRGAGIGLQCRRL